MSWTREGRLPTIAVSPQLDFDIPCTLSFKVWRLWSWPIHLGTLEKVQHNRSSSSRFQKGGESKLRVASVQEQNASGKDCNESRLRLPSFSREDLKAASQVVTGV
uniref:Uncharacterized protein n=1 Tax=Arundo donax TaxID=35708 RepID=A0A0A8ZG85_ARUDO